jgi:hypothetical protein
MAPPRDCGIANTTEIGTPERFVHGICRNARMQRLLRRSGAGRLKIRPTNRERRRSKNIFSSISKRRASLRAVCAT